MRLFTRFALFTLWAGAACANTTLFTNSGTVCTIAAPCVDAGQFGILTSVNAIFQSSNDTLTGRIGFGSGSTFSPTSDTIAGPVDFADQLNTTSGGYKVPSGSSVNNTTITNGTAYDPTLIGAATAEWRNISGYWAGQTGVALPTHLGESGGSGVLTLAVSGGGAHVYTAGYSVNTTQPITISGGVNDLVIINVPAGRTFDIGNSLILSGGITSDQVLINVLGTQSNALYVSASRSNIHADFIVANGGYSVSYADIMGRVFGGLGSVQWYCQSDLNAPPNIAGPVPESGPAAYVLCGLAALLGSRYRFRRRA